MNVVAKRAGLSHTMVSRVERELRRPTLDTLLRITEAMKIDLWPLIKEIEMKVGMGPRKSRSVCNLIAALARRNRAHGNKFKHRSMVVESSA